MFDPDKMYQIPGEELNRLYSYFAAHCQLASTEKRDLENRLYLFLTEIQENHRQGDIA